MIPVTKKFAFLPCALDVAVEAYRRMAEDAHKQLRDQLIQLNKTGLCVLPEDELTNFTTEIGNLIQTPIREELGFDAFTVAWQYFSQSIEHGIILFVEVGSTSCYILCESGNPGGVQKYCTIPFIRAINFTTQDRLLREITIYDPRRGCRRLELSYSQEEDWYFHEYGKRYEFEDNNRLKNTDYHARFTEEHLKQMLQYYGGSLIDHTLLALGRKFLILKHHYESKRILTEEERQQFMSFDT